MGGPPVSGGRSLTGRDFCLSGRFAQAQGESPACGLRAARSVASLRTGRLGERACVSSGAETELQFLRAPSGGLPFLRSAIKSTLHSCAEYSFALIHLVIVFEVNICCLLHFIKGICTNRLDSGSRARALATVRSLSVM